MYTIYISSPVSSYQKPWNTKIEKELKKYDFKVLLPQKITPKRVNHSKFEIEIYKTCLGMINKCDFGLLLYPYGRDCAWEVGYFNGVKKPIYAYISKLNKIEKERLRDWMIKGSLDGAITNHRDIYLKLKNDAILKEKSVYLIKDFSELKKIFGKKILNCGI